MINISNGRYSCKIPTGINASMGQRESSERPAEPLKRAADQLLEIEEPSKRARSEESLKRARPEEPEAVKVADTLLKKRFFALSTNIQSVKKPRLSSTPELPLPVSLYAQIRKAQHKAPFVRRDLDFHLPEDVESEFIGYEIHHTGDGNQIVRVIGEHLRAYKTPYTVYDYRTLSKKFDADFAKSFKWAKKVRKNSASEIALFLAKEYDSIEDLQNDINTKKEALIGPIMHDKSIPVPVLSLFATSIPNYSFVNLFGKLEIDVPSVDKIIHTVEFAQAVIRAIRNEYMLISEPFARRSMDWLGQIYFMQHVMRKDNDDWVETNKQVFVRACRKAILWLLFLFLHKEEEGPGSWRTEFEQIEIDKFEPSSWIQGMVQELPVRLADDLIELLHITNGMLVAAGELVFIDDVPHSRMIRRKRSTGDNVGSVMLCKNTTELVCRTYGGTITHLKWEPSVNVNTYLKNEFEEAYTWFTENKTHLSATKTGIENAPLRTADFELEVSLFLATVQYMDPNVDVRTVSAASMLAAQIFGRDNIIAISVFSDARAFSTLLRSIRLLYLISAENEAPEKLSEFVKDVRDSLGADMLGQITHLRSMLPVNFNHAEMLESGLRAALSSLTALAHGVQSYLFPHLLEQERENMSLPIKPLVDWFSEHEIFERMRTDWHWTSSPQYEIKEMKPGYEITQESENTSRKIFKEITWLTGSMNSMFHAPVFIEKQSSVDNGHLTRIIGEKRTDLQVDGHNIDFSEMQKDALQQDLMIIKARLLHSAKLERDMYTPLFYSGAVDGDVLLAVLDHVHFDGYARSLFWVRGHTELQDLIWGEEFFLILLWMIRNEYLVQIRALSPSNELPDLSFLHGSPGLLGQIYALQGVCCALSTGVQAKKHYDVLFEATRRALGVVLDIKKYRFSPLAPSFKDKIEFAYEREGFDDVARDLSVRMLSEPCFMQGVWFRVGRPAPSSRQPRVQDQPSSRQPRAQKASGTKQPSVKAISSGLTIAKGKVKRMIGKFSSEIAEEDETINAFRKEDYTTVTSSIREKTPGKIQAYLQDKTKQFIDLMKYDGALAAATYGAFKGASKGSEADVQGSRPWEVEISALDTALGSKISSTNVWLGTVLWNMRNDYASETSMALPEVNPTKTDLLGQIFLFQIKKRRVIPSIKHRLDKDSLERMLKEALRMIVQLIKDGHAKEMFGIKDDASLKEAADAFNEDEQKEDLFDEPSEAMRDSKFFANGLARILRGAGKQSQKARGKGGAVPAPEEGRQSGNVIMEELSFGSNDSSTAESSGEESETAMQTSAAAESSGEESETAMQRETVNVVEMSSDEDLQNDM